jgi:tetratricopeptide (TPR) repeat protein
MGAARISLAACLWVPALFAQCEAPATSPAVQAVEPVFADLLRAADIADEVRLAVVDPKCSGDNGGFEGAWFDPSHNRVSLDITLIEGVCAKRAAPRSCYAFLLGHELGHVSQAINRLSGFSRADAGASDEAKEAESVQREADADLRGGVFGYRAGYDALKDAPEILDAVYQTYKLSGKLKGYPDLDRRKEIARAALQDLKKLIPVFETGNLALLLGEYDLAAGCFEHIARRFRSREIFNNKGVAYALQLAAADPAHAPSYPWILDSRSRLYLAAASSRGSTRNLTNKDLFERAKAAFAEAKQLDPGYAPAYLNAACLYDLYDPADRHAMNELEDAAANLREFPSLQPAVTMARGILAARRHWKEEAISAFHEAAAAGRPEATVLAELVAQDKPPQLPVSENRELQNTDEDQIDDRAPSAILRSRAGGDAATIEGDVPFTVGPAKEYDNCTTLLVERSGRRWAFVGTREKYTGKTNHGVALGASREQLDKAYCAPAASPAQSCGAVMLTGEGRYILFKRAQSIFVTNEKDQVIRWFLYAIR